MPNNPRGVIFQKNKSACGKHIDHGVVGGPISHKINDVQSKNQSFQMSVRTFCTYPFVIWMYGWKDRFRYMFTHLYSIFMFLKFQNWILVMCLGTFSTYRKVQIGLQIKYPENHDFCLYFPINSRSTAQWPMLLYGMQFETLSKFVCFLWDFTLL